VAVAPDDLALVQFSSGSTGDPRGVMLSHRNLLANVAAVLAVLQPDETDVNCSWLPLYHDMGLIGGLFMPLHCGRPVVLLSPQGFLLDPKRWLWAIHHHRATISTAPNFAYQLIAGRVDERELAGLDLSCWRLALCGAEPVMPETLAAFARKLAPHGFREEGLLPVYGLAEVALGALFPVPGQPFRRDGVDPAALEAHGRAEPGGRVLSSVGRPLPGFDVRIADGEGRPLPERHVGEIQLQGPSVMLGYLDDPAATARVLVDGWLRTGDLGYMAEGELFVVGRSKDLILKGGRNYAPQDLEKAAERVEGIRRGCVAAFGVPDPTTGTEAVVVVAETREPASAHAALAGAIKDMVHAAVGLRPDHVTLLPPGAVPKTSSGKLQRSRARERWLAGNLAAPQEPGMGEMVRVIGRAMAQRVVGTRRRVP
jgi:acyl-CoA synthetase (AMP-forming)/AMP-acid ligase II